MKLVCLLSGGLDSSTLLYKLHNEGHDVLALSVWYGQRHAGEELKAANRIAEATGVPYKMVNLVALATVMSGSSQTDFNIAVPYGHFEDKIMEVTVTPNRNMIFLSVAAAYAISSGAEGVAYAAHAGDHAVYPDCRSVFVQAMEQALALCHTVPLILEHPFVNQAKADIVAQGAKLGVPFHLTYSCYEGTPVHCGGCATCYERREAFLLAGVVDPTEYRLPMPSYRV